MNFSEIIIGCMLWGHWGKNMTQKEQIGLLEFCFENGNTTFDHADIYGDYTTEAGFGNALSQSRVNRQNIQLISKCGIQLISNNRPNSVKHYNYSKAYIIQSAEASLQNLKTDYLDLFLLHRPSPLMDPETIADAITTLQQSGKILNFGVSNFSASQTALIGKYVNISANQIEFSLSKPNAMQDGTLDYMMSHEIETLSWSPLGLYFKTQSPQIERLKKVTKQLSIKYKVAEEVILLSWILKHPAKIKPVIGTTRKERIINANLATALNLELEDWFWLLEASQGQEVP